MAGVYSPRRGDRVRITRVRPDGGTQFVETGRVVDASRHGVMLDLDSGGRRFIADSESVAAKMPGFTQTITAVA